MNNKKQKNTVNVAAECHPKEKQSCENITLTAGSGTIQLLAPPQDQNNYETYLKCQLILNLFGVSRQP